ncbi:hypothetical protein NDU88_006187 [Pleurodeles waltl]|uniref:Uncharacterized protein n=1 Tax=Pleurodeles waltl TaxID=8319 RepID=A0AAV7WZD0_PLEWA|nr:hypothetical protein NDU88_006187 [Pleurodeles waltl]
MFSPPVASHLLLRAIPRRLAPQRTKSIHLGPSRARKVPSSASGGSRAADIRAPVVRSPGGGSPKVDSSPGSRGGPPAPASLRCVQPLSQGASDSASRAGGRLATGKRPHLSFRSAPLPWGGPVSRASAGRSAPPRPGAAAATRQRPTQAQARTRAHEPTGGRPRGRSRPQAAPVMPAPHPRRFNTGIPPAPRASAPPAGRAAASPQPRAASVTRGPAPGGGETAPPRSPRPRQSSRSTPVTGPPASARPGTDSKSAPPEPIS